MKILSKIVIVTIVCISSIILQKIYAEMINWTTTSVPGFKEVRDSAYGNRTYVVVGDSNTVLYSVDGINWLPANTPQNLTCDLLSIDFAFGQFFAVGKKTNASEGVLLISIDGKNWYDGNVKISDSYDFRKPSKINKIAFGNYKGNFYNYNDVLFMDYSVGADKLFAYTKDGIKWIEMEDIFASDISTMESLGGSIYFKSKFLYDGWGNSFQGNNLFQVDIDYASYGNGIYVGAGAGRKLAYSSGKNISYVASPVITDFTDVTFGRDMFAASGTNGALVVSYDLGRSWSVASIPNLQSVTLNGIRFVGDCFISYGGGRIITGVPTQKRSWQVSSMPSDPKPITSIATNGRIVVAVGNSGQILYSKTGTNWSKARPATSRDLYRVIHDTKTKMFFATGANATLLRSSNGIKWQAVRTSGSGYYDGVARAGDLLFAAGGDRGKFIFSKNGRTWQEGRESLLAFGLSILGDGSSAYVFGPAGQFLTRSKTSSNWRNRGGPNAGVNDLSIWKKTIYVAGGDGNLYSTKQSKPGKWKSHKTYTVAGLYGMVNNADSARQLAAVGELGLVYSQPAAGKWRLEMLQEGAPVLMDILKFKRTWIVAGNIGKNGYVATTNQK